MGPGPTVGKAGAPKPEDTFFFGPISSLTYEDFVEVWRRDVKGFMHGKLIVSAAVVMSNATFLLVVPQLYVDVQIVGYTNGVPEVVAYGATGMSLQAGTPLTPSNGNMDAPPVQTEWDDSYSFDEIAVSVRTMGNGGVPLNNNYAAPLWAVSAGDQINVGIAGKLWK